MLLLGGAGDQPPRQLVQVHVQSYLEMAGPCLKVPRALSLAPATPGTTRADSSIRCESREIVPRNRAWSRGPGPRCRRELAAHLKAHTCNADVLQASAAPAPPHLYMTPSSGSSTSAAPANGSNPPPRSARAGRPFVSDRYNLIDVVVVALSLVALGPWALPMRFYPSAAASGRGPGPGFRDWLPIMQHIPAVRTYSS